MSESYRPMMIITHGEPLGGKSTLGENLARSLGINYIDSGGIMSQVKEKGNQSLVNQGELSQFELWRQHVVPVLQDGIDHGGFVAAGTGRTVEEAQFLFDLSQQKNAFFAVVRLNCYYTVLEKRREMRYREKKRPDDAPEIFNHRFEVYRTQTFPIFSFYEEKHCLLDVDGNSQPSQVLSATTIALLMFAASGKREILC